MKGIKYLVFLLLVVTVSCHKELPDDTVIDNPINGRKVSLNEIANITDSVFSSGDYSFSIPSSLLTDENLIIYAKTKYRVLDASTASDDLPRIRFAARGVNMGDSTIIYQIGKENDYIIQQWRLPSLPPCLTNARIKMTIPNGKELVVSSFQKSDFNVVPNSTTSKTRINAHGCPMIGKFNTIMGFEGAAKAGYPCCIAVPKRTSDGVWVCFHDDDNINEMRYPNCAVDVCKKETNGGDPVYTQYDESGNIIGHDPMPISSLTWDFLQDLVIYNDNYYGIWGVQHIPTLAEFFSVCKRTGMIPMLSVHPAMTVSEWQEVKALAERYGLLGKLDIKLRASDDSVDPAVQVLGNSVLRYSIFVTSEEGLQYSLNKLRSIGQVGQNTLMIELNRTIANREYVEQIVNNGYECSVSNTICNVKSLKLKEMVSWGVSEFTMCYHHSYGLDW